MKFLFINQRKSGWLRSFNDSRRVRMKKILILAYDYPPYVSVGGLRPFSWFQYLGEFGVFPVVVTRQWSNEYGNHLDYIAPGESGETVVERSEKGIVIKTPYAPNLSNKLLLKYGESRFKLLRRFITLFYEFSQFFFKIGTKSELYFEADKFLSENKADIIIATGEPFILFKYASELSKKYDIPWIADYRDPWTQDKKRREIGIPEIWDAFLEKRILSNAGAITTVSKFFQRQIESLISGKSFYVVPNGFDPDAVEKVEEIGQSKEKLSIGFAGTIYNWHPIESFLRVCNDFAGSFQQTPRFEINFYGINIENKIRNLIETEFQNLESVVKIYPKMPNEKLLKKLAENNVFLLFNYYSYMGTKIYDYLGLKRRIILCYGDDKEAGGLKEKFYNMDEPGLDNEHLQEQAIEETNSGVVVKDANHLRSVLNELYSEFETGGFIACNSVNIEKFSRKIQVGNLVKVIEKTMAIYQETQL